MGRVRTTLPWITCLIMAAAGLGTALTGSRAEQLPSEFQELSRAASAQVRESHPDALLFKIRVEHKQGPASPSAQPDVSLHFFSSAERLLIQVSGVELGRTVERPFYAAEEKPHPIPVPSFSVDLPRAVGIAKNAAGMSGELAQAELSVRVPIGQLPVLVWRLQSTGVTTPPRYFFVDALTGTSLATHQVVGPIASADPELQASEDALSYALRREAQRSPSDASLWLEYVVKPILDANNIFECNKLGGAWTLLRMCMP